MDQEGWRVAPEGERLTPQPPPTCPVSLSFAGPPCSCVCTRGGATKIGETRGGPGSRAPTTCRRRSSSTRPPRIRGATSGARSDAKRAAEFRVLPHPGPRASCCRSFGYALTGNRPVQQLGFDTRTERVSALCAFSVKGFEDWRSVPNPPRRCTPTARTPAIHTPYPHPPCPCHRCRCRCRRR